MITKRFSLMLGLLSMCFAATTLAADVKPTIEIESPFNKSTSVEATIIKKLELARPDIKVTSVHPSPIAGLYYAQVGGGSVLVTADGEKMILGEIYNIQVGGISKWEDPALVAERKKLLATVNQKDSIIFKPAKTKAVVYVFTDVDCGYCRKLNSQMSAYNELGIEIRYLAFPRAGIPSSAADKLVTAWCSADKQKALTMLKEDQPLPMLTCDNPVASQFDLGGRIGVNGTPALWLPNGELRPGYLPPDVLAKELGIL